MALVLRSVTLENIRSYTHGSIIFPEQSTVLSGDIGSGKSTVLLAIEFALFGLRSDVSGAHLLRHGEQHGSVELTFSLSAPHYTNTPPGSAQHTSTSHARTNNARTSNARTNHTTDVRIRRGLKRTRNTVQQEAGWIAVKNSNDEEGNGSRQGAWVKTEATASELKAKVLALLGYPQELLSKSKTYLYRFTVYTPQEQMKYILACPESERRDTIRKIFGIDTYTTISANTAMIMRELRSRARTAQAAAEGLDEEKKKKQEEEQQLAALCAAHEKMQTAHRLLEQQLAESRKQADELHRLQQRAQQLATRHALAQARLHELERNYARIQKEQEQLAVKKQETAHCLKTLPTLATLPALPGTAGEWNEHALRTEKEKMQQAARQCEQEHAENRARRAAREEKKRFLQKRSGELARYTQEPALFFTALEQKQGEQHALGKGDSEEDSERDREGKREGDGKRDREGKREKDMPQRIAEASAREEQLAEEHVELIQKEEQLAAAHRAAQEGLDRLCSIEQCPLCRQHVAKEHKHAIAHREEPRIREMEAALAATRAERARRDEQRQQAKEAVQQLRSRAARAEQLAHEIRVLEMRLQDALQKQREYEEVQAAQKQLAAESAEADEQKKEAWLCAQLEQHRQRISLLENAEQQLARLREIEQRISKNEEQMRSSREAASEAQKQESLLREELKQYENIGEQYAAARQRTEAIAAEERRHAIRLAETKKEEENRKQQLARLSSAIESKEGSLRNSYRLNQLHAWLGEYFLMVAARIEKEVMRTIYSHFNELFRKWFGMLVEDEALQARLSDDFSVIAEQNGYETAVEQLSGGEKTAVALAYRLALNKVINDVVAEIQTKNLLILDEPTDGFSARQLDRVRSVLNELQAQQVIIVSHEQKVESFVEHVIRIEKRGHESVVVG